MLLKQLLTNKQPRGWCVSGAVPLSSTRCCWRLFTIRSSSTSWRNNVWIKTNMRLKSVKNKTGKKFKKLFQNGGCLRTHTHTRSVVFLQQLQDGGEHHLRSIQTPDKIQMVPVLNVLMEDQVSHLQTDRQTERQVKGRQTGRRHRVRHWV